jgi:hypothetical protein
MVDGRIDQTGPNRSLVIGLIRRDGSQALEPADGLVIIYARLRRLDVREQFWFHLEELIGERVTPTIFELNIADWDEGLWREEIDWMRSLFEGTSESVVLWQFAGGAYSRLTVGGDA